MNEAQERRFLGLVRREIRQEVRHEIRAAALVTEPRPCLPPPAAVDAEAEVISALLEGHCSVADLAPLEAQHFYGRFHREVFEAISLLGPKALDLDVLARLLTDRGIAGPVRDELEQLRDAQPFASAERLCQHVRTILDRWRERQFLALLQCIDLEVRTGVLSVDGSKPRLREFFQKRLI